jgi:BirA family biotin operon repressor/biotin-[acetyl-CoA-carboxylase] ligase
MKGQKNITVCSRKASPNKLLMILLAKKGSFVSGEDISEELGITRSGVWKQVNSLRELGYNIESSTRLGYRIDKSPDLLMPEEIWSTTHLSFIGGTIYYSTTLDSTNEQAKRLAGEGAPHGTLILAEEQQKGRGRMGRDWISPKSGGIWLSIILRPNMAPYEAPKLTILSAVAVAEAIRKKTGLAAQIKWPNDILINGKKVCGILTELNTEIDVINHVVIGVGINVNNLAFPKDLKQKAASLKQIKSEHIDRTIILAGFLESFETLYQTAMNDGFEGIFQKWRSLCCNLGKHVNIIGRAESFNGIALDINNDGALLVRTQDGKVVQVISGDVSLDE